ncbi:MAG: hypothetical protein ACM3JH_06550 [Acidithiobacillales bacterium]
MDLSGHIRAGRAERRRKEPFRPTLYTRVSALVRRYGLDDGFLRDLEAPPATARRKERAAMRPRRKEPLVPSLFTLSTPEEHRVTIAILARVSNPFLEYATSPDEVLLARELFRRNPSLSPETLACHHFETLLLAEEDGGPP